MSEPMDRSKKIRQRLVATVAGLTLGVTGAFAVASAQDGPAPVSCRPTETDLLRAAAAAERLEVERPELFAESPRPADHDDLRLAAEWARRLAYLDPDGRC
jgi:hypothetical protein